MASGNRELIQIEAGEDVNSVRDRLSFIHGKRVLLVWPEEGTALIRKLDLVLVQREAMRRAIRLAIVTHDPQVIRHAQELNISTFETIGASERGRWKRGRAKVFTDRNDRPKDSPENEEVLSDLKDIASRNIDRPPMGTLPKMLIRVGLIAILLGIIGVGVYLLVPSASVKIIPAVQMIEQSVQIVINPDPSFTSIDVENGILPATVLKIEVEESTSIPTTGVQEFGSALAVGEAVFINQTSATLTIPLGTTVSTTDDPPILFRTTQEIEVIGGGEITLPIEALPSSAGEIGNLEAGRLISVVGPLGEQVTVNNPAPTRAGVAQVERAVTDSDRQTLELTVNQLLQERAYTEIQNSTQISPDDFVLLDTLQIVEERDDWKQWSANVGDLQDTLTLTKRVVVQVLVVNTRLGQQIVFAQMARQVVRGRSIDPNTIEYRTGDVLVTPDTVFFTMSGNCVARAQIDPEAVKAEIANKSFSEAIDYLRTRVDIAPNSIPELTFSPDWMWQMPTLPIRISLTIEETTP
jgi:hypothetical protein